jgi:hypothetical protein
MNKIFFSAQNIAVTYIALTVNKKTKAEILVMVIDD